MKMPTPKAGTRRKGEGRTGGGERGARVGLLRTTLLAVFALFAFTGRLRLPMVAVAAAAGAEATTVATAASLLSPELVVHDHDHVPRTPPALPYYLGGRPENFQVLFLWGYRASTLGFSACVVMDVAAALRETVRHLVGVILVPACCF